VAGTVTISIRQKGVGRKERQKERKKDDREGDGEFPHENLSRKKRSGDFRGRRRGRSMGQRVIKHRVYWERDT